MFILIQNMKTGTDLKMDHMMITEK